MRPGRIIFWSAVTTVVGSILVRKSKTNVPGFSN